MRHCRCRLSLRLEHFLYVSSSRHYADVTHRAVPRKLRLKVCTFTGSRLIKGARRQDQYHFVRTIS
jgi:hypothetical protein